MKQMTVGSVVFVSLLLVTGSLAKFDSCPFSKYTPTFKDLSRAAQRKPTAPFLGSDHAAISTLLNDFLKNTPGLKVKECSEFTNDELNNLHRMLLSASSAEFNDVYVATSDNRALRHGSIEEFENEWRLEEERMTENPELSRVVMDGKCHEAVMYWIHHVSRGTQERFIEEGHVLPLLPAESHREKFGDAKEGSSEFHTMQIYRRQSDCDDCHAR